LYFIFSSFICQDTSFTLSPPQFPCCHLLATGIKVSKQYQYWIWQSIKVLPNTQYYPILQSIGQYPIPQCQYRSNPTLSFTGRAELWNTFDSDVNVLCHESRPLHQCLISVESDCRRFATGTWIIHCTWPHERHDSRIAVSIWLICRTSQSHPEGLLSTQHHAICPYVVK